ncbi:MAG: transglycosylase domain-containing protein [Thermoleophilaceae bacterium]
MGVVGLLVVVAAMSGVGYIVAIAATAPDLDELQPIDKGATSVIYAADGSRLGYVQSDIIRDPIAWRDMPIELKRATVAIEDERFYEHEGVDYESIVRAAIKNVESGKSLQGGSTITQQLVRALYIKDPERDLNRKIREAKLASELEQKRSKRWILREYLNSVPFGTVKGRTAVGIAAAASVFFGKRPERLELHEAALLAGLPQAPSQYNPFRNPTAAIERRNEVLQAMVDNGHISPGRAERAMAEELGLNPGRRYTSRREPYFFDFVQELLIEEYGVNVYRQGGLKIHTTIDPDLQKAGKEAIDSRLNLPGDPSGAVIAIDPSNGHIRAMANSGSYSDRTFNLAGQGHRQPGSAFKTMALVTALRQGVNPRSTTYVSKKLDLQIPGYGNWSVSTYDNSYGGRMDLVRATLKSDNTVYAQLALDLGPENVAETAHLLGIKSKLDSVPSETLGGLTRGVSPLEMASAYATLAAGGMRSEPKAITKVEFPDGKSDELGEPERKRVISDGVAYEATRILQQNVQSGTGGNAQIGCPAAGKTGTTDNFADAWFVGYTPELATAVWVGYPNARKPMRGVHGINVAGGTFPAQIWGGFMNYAKGSFCGGFAQPSEPVQFKPFFGKYSRTGTSSDRDYSYTQPQRQQGQGNENGGTSPDDGGEDFDPRLYESPPQDEPESPPERDRGNGDGNGRGNGNRGGEDGGGPVDGGPGGGAPAAPGDA